ncbi:MAG: hypothetical protein NC311_13295 [Muribaculaceae bacterium]|nr:hypothetical protein [Muribaculaceae bacterium]
MAKLTDKQKKQIIAESVQGASGRALAAKYKVSQTTIRRVLQSDPELSQKVSQKHEENVISVLAHMETKKQTVCDLIDKFLAAMGDPEKIAGTPLNQLATAMGIVIDKYTAHEAAKAPDAATNNLFEALDSIGEEDLDGIPEIQQSAENDSAVVEDEELPN